MPNLAALISRHKKLEFLGETDLSRMRAEAEDIDAAYGETLDPLPPARSPIAVLRPRAA